MVAFAPTSRSTWFLFAAMVLLGTTLRLGYGIARYHGSPLSLTGEAFIRQWDNDALEHVLIAKALIEERSYRVVSIPDLQNKNIRVGRDALFKAPLYEMFLAGVFAVSGFNFTLFFPVQALLGGLLSGFAALVSLEAFRKGSMAYFAGTAAAMHPVLVNSASQPYNENLFFALMFACIWAFLCWFRSGLTRWAVVCGVLAALASLCRETALPLVGTMTLFSLFAPRWNAARIAGVAVIAVVAALMILPWTVRNYLREGAVVPVASATGHVLSIGNNECVAADAFLSWYWADGPCRSLDARRTQLLDRVPAERRQSWVVQNHVDTVLAIEWIARHPLEYSALTIRRVVTGLLPFHPRQTTGRIQRIVLSVYWLLVLPAGFAGMFLSLRRPQPLPVLLALLIAASLLPLMLIYFSPDMRYRVGADLLLASFAGYAYTSLRLRMRK